MIKKNNIIVESKIINKLKKINKDDEYINISIPLNFKNFNILYHISNIVWTTKDVVSFIKRDEINKETEEKLDIYYLLKNKIIKENKNVSLKIVNYNKEKLFSVCENNLERIKDKFFFNLKLKI